MANDFYVEDTGKLNLIYKKVYIYMCVIYVYDIHTYNDGL